MADVRITALPTAQSPITGDELVPIVQNGLTVQTTVSAITQSPSLTQTFLTVGQQTGLPNSRYFSTGAGLGITDGGAQGAYTIALNGTAASLEAASAGVIVKTAPNTIAARTLVTSGNGINVADGDGIAGNPTFALTGLAQALANATGTGLLALGSSTTISPVTITGTSNQIGVTGGDGSSTPTISLAADFIAPGTAGITLPNGTTAQRGSTTGQVRYNLDTNRYEGYYAGSWQIFGIGDGTLTSVSGTASQITVSNAGSVATVAIASNPVLPGAASVQVPSGTTAQRGGSIGSFRLNLDTGLFEGYNGTWNSFAAGSGVTSIATGTGLTGGPITSTGTISIDSTVATLTGNQTLTNKTISGTNNTLSDIGNGSLTNSSVTYNGVNVALGGSGTITAVNPYALTIGTGLSGTSYNGSGAVTVAIANTGAVAATYGTAARTITQTVNAQGQITSIYDQLIDGIALTTGTISTAPTSNNDITNKSYVDGLVATGLTYHQPVQASTTASLASTTGGTVTYNNGVAGVGATLTLSLPLLILDGYTLLNTNRILVKDEVNQAYNGIYTWATGGTVLTRATDADTYGTAVGQLSQNDYFFTQNGTVNKGTSYVVTTVGTIVFGTTAITFAEFSSSQVYTAGTGLTLLGNQFSLTAPVTAALGGTGQTSYTTGDLLFASGSTALSKLALGTSSYVLTAGAAAPQYVAQSTLSVGSATTATTATNLASGAAGSVPYQTGAGATSMLALGTNGYVLTAGASAPTYVAQSTLSVGTATDATNTAITDDAATAVAVYPTWVTANTGNLPQKVTSTKLSFVPSTGALTATGGISGGTF